MLWQVQGSRLFVLGSVHLLDVPTLPLSEAAWNAFNGAARVIFEHDFSQSPDVTFARLPAGETLSAVVPAPLFAAVEQRCRELSLDLAAIASFQPWFVGLWLGAEIAKRHGWDPAKGVDTKLCALGKDKGKSIEYLERATDALSGFSAAPASEQRKMLSFAAEDVAAGVEFFRRLIQGWKDRRADAILACVKDRLSHMPTMFSTVIAGRNRLWLPKLLAMLRDGQPTIVVVGALHTVGPAGVPALIRANGHEVVAVDVVGE